MKPIHPLALFRLSVLGPLVSRERLAQGELRAILRDLASKAYDIPDSKRHYFSVKTIERWYYAYQRDGIDALAPQSRRDKGTSQLPDEIVQAILQAKKDNPSRSLNTLIQLLQAQGVTAHGQLSRASVHRLLVHHQLSKRTPSDSQRIERRAYQAQYAGDIWYGDVLHGPRIQTARGLRKSYLVSLFDDASRLICHSAFCLDETNLSIEGVFKQALLKRGLPKKLVVDNGSAYKAQTLQQVCARIKVPLIYCRPYEPQGKAKLERWHRTFREQFLTELAASQADNLDALNARLWVWIEQVYHCNPHSALDGKTPLECWRNDLAKVQPLGELARQLDAYFYHRVKRSVRKDGTLSYAGQLFEVPYEHVGKSVYLVIDPQQQSAKWIESLDYEQLGPVHPLDKIANLQRSRQRPLPVIPTSKAVASFIDVTFEKTQQSYTLPNPDKEEDPS